MRNALLALAVLIAAGPARPAERLDLNTARAADLEALPGIGDVTAERIVRIRERNGAYRCVEELRAVPRLSQAQYESLQRHTFVVKPDPRCGRQERDRRAGRELRPQAAEPQ